MNIGKVKPQQRRTESIFRQWWKNQSHRSSDCFQDKTFPAFTCQLRVWLWPHEPYSWDFAPQRHIALILCFRNKMSQDHICRLWPNLPGLCPCSCLSPEFATHSLYPKQGLSDLSKYGSLEISVWLDPDCSWEELKLKKKKKERRKRERAKRNITLSLFPLQ